MARYRKRNKTNTPYPYNWWVITATDINCLIPTCWTLPTAKDLIDINTFVSNNTASVNNPNIHN